MGKSHEMFRALYDCVLRLAHHRHADRYLAAVSFAESSVFPIPPDVMLVPMMLARRERAYRIALICTVASILGACVGYAIGYFLHDVAQRMLEFFRHGAFNDFTRAYTEYGAAIILVKGLTPIPFKLVTIASGLARFNFGLFLLTATITRAFRFFLIAFLIKRWGAPVQVFVEKYLNWIGIGVLIALLGGFAALAYL